MVAGSMIPRAPCPHPTQSNFAPASNRDHSVPMPRNAEASTSTLGRNWQRNRVTSPRGHVGGPAKEIHMRAQTIAFALASLTSLLPRLANAHFNLLQPKSWVTTEDGGKGVPPCGQGTPSNVVTKVQGGHPLTVKIQEFVFHPGHYRIALLKSHDDPFADPMTVDKNGVSVSAAIQMPPVFPVLADDVFDHTKPLSGPQQIDVMIPNVDCAKCDLQVIEFMAEHGLNQGGGYFYHHCAELQIVADPSLGSPDAGAANAPPDAAALDAATGAGGSAGTGGSDAGGGKGGKGGSGGSGGSGGTTGGSGAGSGGQGGSAGDIGGAGGSADGTGGTGGTRSKGGGGGCAFGGRMAYPAGMTFALALIGWVLGRRRRSRT
jgi:hypothetical protein